MREISNKSCCSPLETDKLSKFISEYGADKTTEAIEIAVMRNRRSLSYIEGILKNTGGDENGSQKEKATVVRRGRTSGRGGLYKSRKVETVEDVERKFEHETSGWD
nr:DnaD domain protein [Megamonas hypermegale]